MHCVIVADIQRVSYTMVIYVFAEEKNVGRMMQRLASRIQTLFFCCKTKGVVDANGILNMMCARNNIKKFLHQAWF